jgi:septum formation protein
MLWSRLDKPLVLASSSPRRREILSKMGVSFSVCEPRVEDEARFLMDPPFATSLRSLALAKADSVARQRPDALVLAADTVVCAGERVMGKPATRDEARSMIRRLSGRAHEVHSGVALVCADRGFSKTGSSCTRVFFRDVAPEEIELYLDTQEHVDKAGAYAIQGRAMSFVEKIEGCFYNVVGLPVSETIRLLTAYTERT